MLELKNIIKSFGLWIIIKNLNLIVKDGEILSIVGFLGVGKIMLLCCIMGFEKVNVGEFLVDG